MAKRSTNIERDKFIIEEEQVKPKRVSVEAKQEIPALVSIRFVYPATYNYMSLSGEKKTWNGAGSIRNDISREDANILLSKKRIGNCCGSGSKIIYIFEEV